MHRVLARGRSRIAAAFALACACASPAGGSPRGAATGSQAPAALRAPIHHDVKVALDPGARRLAVEDTVTLSSELRERLGGAVELSLHAGLSPERVGPGAPLERAAGGSRADASGGDARVPVERFTLPLARGERSFTVRYAGELFHAVEQRGSEYARGMSESPGLVTPEGAVLSGASSWIPEVADELLTFTLEATVPAGWEVIAQGARTRRERGDRQTHVRWESPEPQEEIVLAAGPLVERSRPGARVAVETFLRSDDPALAAVYLDAGERYLAMYEGLLGAYPYAKFALVENFWETGYGMPSFTLLGSRVIRLPFLVHSSYPHEILHNWWGNGVFVDPEQGNWAEGLTAYLADHLIQEQRGQGAEYRRTSLQRYADYVAEAADFPVREFRARHDSVTQAVGYDKVLMIFHMLRQRIGDERFVSGLRRFYEEERFRAAGFADLARAMGAAAGEDLGPWLAQWLDRPGAPAVRLDSAAVRRHDGSHRLELTLSQTQDGAPFEVDVPVAVTLPSSSLALRRSVRLSERRQRFSLALEEAPARVDVDPEFDVFRRLDPAELPPALSGAFGAREALMVLPSSAPAGLRSAYEELAERWRGAGATVVTDDAIGDVPAGKAVWIFGWENRLREVVAEGLAAHGGALTGDGLRVGTTALDRREHAVVVAVRSPADPTQVLVFVGADRAEALPGLGRKLPHYGKYGLLGFEGDEPENVAKQAWPVLRSPMAAALGAPDRLSPRAALPARAALAELPPLADAPARAR